MEGSSVDGLWRRMSWIERRSIEQEKGAWGHKEPIFSETTVFPIDMFFCDPGKKSFAMVPARTCLNIIRRSFFSLGFT